MKKGWIYIAISTILFSTMEIALKEIAGDFNPMQLTMTRFLAGGIFLVPFAVNTMKKRGVHIAAKDLRFFALLGLLGIAVSMTFYQLAITDTNASVVAVLFSCNPAFVMLFAALLLHEVIHRRNVAAIILEAIGIIVIINPFHVQIGASGIVFTLLSVLTFALYGVLGKRKCAEYGGVAVTCMSFLFGALELLAFAGMSHIPAIAGALAANGLDIFADIPFFTGYNIENVGFVLYIFIGITGAGFASYFTAMEKTSANSTSLIFFFKPVLATILAFFILHEAVPSNMVAGIVLILIGSMANILPGLLKTRLGKGRIGKAAESNP
ncbi:DMT family transporter [Christensenella tenuis]|uniref:EamA family transporter n=1 Tax=Christensenella tenuis TaxID=2763033 RepID=A0ABR7EE76_9FIRM|nr:EamA family transporter [Christensenella tenuis]